MIRLNRNLISSCFAAQDWGFTHAGVLLVFAIDSDGRLYVVHQVYRTGRLIGWWTEQAKALHEHFGFDAVVCDPAQPSFIEQYRAAGLPAEAAENPDGSRTVNTGIDAVASRLVVQGDGRPRLYVFADSLEEADPDQRERGKPTCVQEEFTVYQWKSAPDGRPSREEPLKINDDGMDALRYGVCWADAREGFDTGPPQAGLDRASAGYDPGIITPVMVGAGAYRDPTTRMPKDRLW